jgi:hypothetical protein
MNRTNETIAQLVTRLVLEFEQMQAEKVAAEKEKANVKSPQPMPLPKL